MSDEHTPLPQDQQDENRERTRYTYGRASQPSRTVRWNRLPHMKHRGSLIVRQPRQHDHDAD